MKWHTEGFYSSKPCSSLSSGVIEHSCQFCCTERLQEIYQVLQGKSSFMTWYPRSEKGYFAINIFIKRTSLVIFSKTYLRFSMFSKVGTTAKTEFTSRTAKLRYEIFLCSSIFIESKNIARWAEAPVLYLHCGLYNYIFLPFFSKKH